MGGGGPRAFRSFGDSGRDKRSRIFLTRGGNTQTNDDIFLSLKRFLRNILLRPVVGWEQLFEVPEEAVIILSTDPSYLGFPQLDEVLDQVVIVSRNRAIATLNPQLLSTKLQEILLQWNAQNPQSAVKKVSTHDGKLLFNLQKPRISVVQWSRPRGMPPPLPLDLDCTIEGAEL